MFIDGFSINYYRSFGEEEQLIGPLSKINVFIGQNNSGKSNILSFIKNNLNPILSNILQEHLSQFRKFKDLITQKGIITNLYNDLNINIDHNFKTTDLKFSIGINLDRKNDTFNKNVYQIIKESPYPAGERIQIQTVFKNAPFKENSIAWYQFNYDHKKNKFYLNQDQKIKMDRIQHNWSNLYEILFNKAADSQNMNFYIEEVIKKLIAFSIIPSFIIELPAIRKIDKLQYDNRQDFSGNMLIDQLARLQNPNITERNKQDLFNKINTFLQIVLEKENCAIEIPYERDNILVNIDGKTMPLESLGTGIHETIIIAAAATICQNMMVCIEEPELHLHPRLQKKLVNYLLQNTNNQYFITSHSVHFMDIEGVNVFHVTHDGKNSIIDYSLTDHNKYEICRSLGYHASDLMQANCIIWVEGPSDRIYVNYWLNQQVPDLKEGIHYSIMFYGGRLLFHLSLNDSNIEEFISLRKLNRNTIIIIDSDKKKKSDVINETKERIVNECNDGIAWITAGREIENYIEQTIIEEILKEKYGNDIKLNKHNKFSKCYEIKKNDGSQINVNKVWLAKQVVQKTPTLTQLDLKEQIDKLIVYINKANGI